jgi:serine/threonine protein kinase
MGTQSTCLDVVAMGAQELGSGKQSLGPGPGIVGPKIHHTPSVFDLVFTPMCETKQYDEAMHLPSSGGAIVPGGHAMPEAADGAQRKVWAIVGNIMGAADGASEDPPPRGGVLGAGGVVEHLLMKKCLGKGSFGTVYAGRCQHTNQNVAVKLIQRDPIQPLPLHVHQEIEALHALQHPCIVKLISVVVTNFNVQLYLQLFEMDLHRLLQGPPMVEAHAKQVATMVLQGLAHMHSNGFVHRDLKPANILVDHHPLLVAISDLGSALHGENLPSSYDVVTTMPYRAPESLLGSSYKKPCDIWSVGLICAELEHNRFMTPVNRCGRHQHGQELATMGALSAKLAGEPWPNDTLGRDILHLKTCTVASGLGLRFAGLHFRRFATSMLQFNSQNRLNVDQVLGHSWLGA